MSAKFISTKPNQKKCLSILLLELALRVLVPRRGQPSTNTAATECMQLVSNITGVQLMNVTCGQLLTSLTLGQLPNDLIPGVAIQNLLYGFSLSTSDLPSLTPPA